MPGSSGLVSCMALYSRVAVSQSPDSPRARALVLRALVYEGSRVKARVQSSMADLYALSCGGS